MARKTGFDKFLAQQLKDPRFARSHEQALREIEEVDALVGRLEELRAIEGIDKAALARRLNMIPSSVRRLLTKRAGNPGIKTLLRIGAELGYRLEWTRIEATGSRGRRTRADDREKRPVHS